MSIVAGHPAPILVRKGGCPECLDVCGFPIGMVDEAAYEESVIDLQPGDRLYLHSDGLTEEINDCNEEFGSERLLAAIAEGQTLGLQESVELLIQKVIAWRAREHLKDDVSILAISAA